MVPLWRDADGRMLALVGSSAPQGTGPAAGVPEFRVVDVSQGYSSGLRYDIGPHVAAYAQLVQRNWLTLAATPVPAAERRHRLSGCQHPAGGAHAERRGGCQLQRQRYRFDLLFDSSRSHVTTAPLLPRVLPQSPTAMRAAVVAGSHHQLLRPRAAGTG